MKIKFLSIAFAFVVALALASCGSSGPIEPTGELDKDVEALINKMKDANSIKDQGELKEYTDVYTEFEKFYEEKGEKDKFTQALADATKDDTELKEIVEGIQLLTGFESMATKDDIDQKANEIKDNVSKALDEGAEKLDKKLDDAKKELEKVTE